MPPVTGNILIVYGHGGVTEAQFNFSRPAAQKVVLFSGPARASRSTILR